MAHTHEFDCIICGAHLDSEEALTRHDRENHAPRRAINPEAPAEPMGNEKKRVNPGKDGSME
jgi:hypothetical protein